MKPREKPRWRLSEDDRVKLCVLLDAVPARAHEDSPEFLELLDRWEGIRAPWNLMPPVKAYRTLTGWLVESVPAVLAAIRAHLEAS